ncbi:hypothetical protein P7C70_g6792, partial [Phenoliferia sp. Uapishka_3]
MTTASYMPELPPEIISQILPHMSQQSLSRTSSTCRWLLAECAPLLYRDITIHGPAHAEQLLWVSSNKVTHESESNPSIEPFLALSQIESLTLHLGPPQFRPPNVYLDRISRTQSLAIIPLRSLHLVLRPDTGTYTSFLALFCPLHLTISREGHNPSARSAYFPMFLHPTRTSAADSVLQSWTSLKSITLVDCYPLSVSTGFFLFESVIFEEPVEIIFDFTNAGQNTGTDEVMFKLLFTNIMTKGVTRVSNLGKLVIKVGSEEDRKVVEEGRRLVHGFEAIDRAEVVLVTN